MPPLLTEIYRLQDQLTGLDDYERNLLKMCANLLESRYEVPEPRNLFNVTQFMDLPGRWELLNGRLYPYESGE